MNVDENFDTQLVLDAKEKEIIKAIQAYPETIALAAAQHSPAIIANYTYDLAKLYNSFFQNITILGADTPQEKAFRVALSAQVGTVIKAAFGLLGIDVPERM